MDWSIEHGTLWVVVLANGLPQRCLPPAEAEFCEVGEQDAIELAVTMELPDPALVLERFRTGRRCFCLRIAGQIVSYGWVTCGPEEVGELNRTFQLHQDEAYIWHCGTLPAWRGQHCYSALLSQIVYAIADTGVSRIWIGASRQNQPSVRGFVNAGFQPVIDLTYRRLQRLTLIWFRDHPSATPDLIASAYRIIVGHSEWRLGPLVVGYT